MTTDIYIEVVNHARETFDACRRCGENPASAVRNRLSSSNNEAQTIPYSYIDLGQLFYV